MMPRFEPTTLNVQGLRVYFMCSIDLTTSFAKQNDSFRGQLLGAAEEKGVWLKDPHWRTLDL